MLYFAKNQHQAAEVVNSKPELLACAAHWNPFRSQTFAWVDAGVARSGNRLDKETYDFDIGKFKMDVRLHQKSYHTKFLMDLSWCAREGKIDNGFPGATCVLTACRYRNMLAHEMVPSSSF